MLCFTADLLCFGGNPRYFIPTIQAMATLCSSWIGTDCAENTVPVWKCFSKQLPCEEQDVKGSLCGKQHPRWASPNTEQEEAQ